MQADPDRDDAPEHPARDLLEMLYWMRLTRAVDDRTQSLFKQGRIPGVVFSQRGHEAISVGSAMALRAGDVVAPLHRDLGAYLVRGMTPARVFAQALGRVGSPSRGRDVNTHGFGDLSLGILGYVSHLPQSMPVALGAAFAFRYRDEARVALNYFGDGSSSEGGCHESLNLAAVLRAPVIYIVENNRYAYSTPTRHQFRISDLADRAAAYGMPGEVVDGNDVVAVREVTAKAARRARSGDGPTLIEAKTIRMHGHAIHDRADYVLREDIDEGEARDPIRQLERRLREQGLLDDETSRRIDSRVAREVDRGVEEAEASPWPDPATLEDGVFTP